VIVAKKKTSKFVSGGVYQVVVNIADLMRGK